MKYRIQLTQMFQILGTDNEGDDVVKDVTSKEIQNVLDALSFLKVRSEKANIRRSTSDMAIYCTLTFLLNGEQFSDEQLNALHDLASLGNVAFEKVED